MLLLTISVSAQVKKIAILETVDKEGNISYSHKLMLRSNLVKAITNTPGYEAYDRTDIDAIMGEQDFQRTGMVSEDQIRRLGLMTGASYILVAEAAEVDESNLFITAKILNVETAKTEMTDNILMASTPADIQYGCECLSYNLLGVRVNSPSSDLSRVRVNSSSSGVSTPKKSLLGKMFGKRDKKPSDVSQEHEEGVQNSIYNNSVMAYQNNAQYVPQQSMSAQLVRGNASVSNFSVGDMLWFDDGSSGLIFYVSGGIGLAVSLDEAEAKWEDNKLKNCHNIPNIPDVEKCQLGYVPNQGERYTDEIIHYLGAAQAPAAYWCAGHGNGWHLPTVAELTILMNAIKYSDLNKSLLMNGGVALSSGYYWACDEHDKKEAFNVSTKGWTPTEEKTEINKVRAVKAFKL